MVYLFWECILFVICSAVWIYYIIQIHVGEQHLIMLFSSKLSQGIYPPWRKQYLAYDKIKRLLKDSDDEWSENDESHFVQELDQELDKVYGFEKSTYEKLSKRLEAIDNTIDTSEHFDRADIEQRLEEILEEATQLDRFRRLNYTGFSKIVKLHDKHHARYQVRPLLRARLNAQPHHTEDYSPLLHHISQLYTQIGSDAGAQSVQSLRNGEQPQDGFTTLQFWVHPDNLMEVKTRILRRLPVLVYNTEENDEDSSGRDPTVTSLYLDNSHFELYESQLMKRQTVPTSLRFRWYGHLYEKPDIVLEQQNEEDGRITRITLKDKTIDSFLAGDTKLIKRQGTKLQQRNVPESEIKNYEDSANELQEFVTNHKLEPMLRTVYRRAAFEIPGDDRVRMILDSDILFIREDTLNKSLPIRDPAHWRRTDLDQPNVNLASLLRKGEYARFPYSVLEVRLHNKVNERPTWIEELKASGLVREVPHFTKFLQGVAVLYGEDERLDSLPFWLNDLEEAGSGSAHGHQHGGDPSQQGQSTTKYPVTTYRFDEDLDEDEDFEESEDSGIVEDESPGPVDPEQTVGLPTWTNSKLDQDSEDEEVVLPPGVHSPSEWLKNSTPVKIEAKVWLANERTFNKWLHITVLLSALTFTLYSSVSKAASPHTATIVAYILFALTLFSGAWGYTQYLTRMHYIRERSERPLDNPLGPLIVSGGLLFALIVNFSSKYWVMT